ncbi:MAG: S8 family serine peptidase [Phycisphaerales bacterium]|nr:S8 family serine peptidase [Phycisphaerales bacterium]
MLDRWSRKLSAVALLVAAMGASAGVGALESPGAASQPEAAPALFVEIPGVMLFSGQVIAKPLQFDDMADRGMSQQQISGVIAQTDALLAQFVEVWYEPLVDHHVLRVPAGMTDAQFVASLLSTGLFEFVEPDWTLFPIANCTTDTNLPSQWHHNSNRMASCEAWGIHTGTPAVTVGICDTGVQTNHPDLLLNRKEGYNAVNRVWESNGGQIGPVHSHGTMTTGCAAANGNNGRGVSGSGWNLSHRMMRVSNSSSGNANLSDLTHAALTSIQAGDKVANVSYSGVNSSSVRSTATQIKNLGGLLTWSAGNDGANLNWGNRDADDVIVVGATTSGDSKSSFSAYGPSVDLMAPGSGVYTTNSNSGYAAVDGTSFSAPLTAGLIGLIWSYNPGLSPDEVEAILKAGCDDLGSAGVDNTYGYGRIDSYESLLLAGGSANTPPVITVVSPGNGSVFTQGATIVFDSNTVDAEDGDLSAQVTWTSFTDGLLGTGDFSSSSLSVGIHFITVAVTDSGGLTDSEFLSISVEAPALPAAPTPIATTEGQPGALTFTWTDNSNNETGFTVQRQQKVGSTWTNTTTVGTLPANATSSTDSPGSGAWRYRVRASNGAGNSSWTAFKIAKPATPTGMTGSAAGSTANLAWNDNSGIESGYTVQRQQKVGSSWTNTTTVATTAQNATSYADTPGSGVWRYRVRAANAGAASSWSSWSGNVNIP